MNHHYNDITSRIAEPPKWYDEHAVPRYDDFTPDEVADISADEVALVEIACQNCGTRFLVAFASNIMRHIVRGGANKPYNRDNLAQAIRSGIIHYGDPPNAGCCPAGPTMSSEVIRVVEYWARDSFEWVRNPALEVTLNEAEIDG